MKHELVGKLSLAWLSRWSCKLGWPGLSSVPWPTRPAAPVSEMNWANWKVVAGLPDLAITIQKLEIQE